MKLITAIALLFAASAFAQEKLAVSTSDSASGGATAAQPSLTRDATPSRALFDRLDRNKDGYLTGTELTSPEAQSTNWLSIDRDGNGRISRSEFTAISPVAESASVGATR